MKNGEILSKLFSVIYQECISTVIHYGNTSGRDVDLLVLLKDNYRYSNFTFENLDITCIGLGWLPVMSRNLDPAVTEPLITGRIIYGDSNISSLNRIEDADEDAPIYLLECAEIFYSWAVILAWNQKYSDALFTLTFVHSYCTLGSIYWSDQKVILFKDLLQGNNGDWLQRSRILVKTNAEITNSQLHQAFQICREVLTSLNTMLGFK